MSDYSVTHSPLSTIGDEGGTVSEARRAGELITNGCKTPDDPARAAGRRGVPAPPAGGTVDSRGGGVSLGNTTSIASSLYPSHSEGFTQEFERKASRFRLQSVARGILPRERVATCFRFRRSADSPVELHYSNTRKRAYYGNLMVCGSIWGCPVCSSKISETRRLELRGFFDAVRDAGHSRFMVTYTLRHNAGDTLADLNGKLTNARRFLKSGEYFKRFQSEHALVGSVAAKEITFGGNGWHPHVHEIFVSTSPADELDRSAITDYFKNRWQLSIQRLGADASWQHGLDVRFVDDAGAAGDNFIDDYISKFGQESSHDEKRGSVWDESHELAKQVSKNSRSVGGATPFHLLGLHADYLDTGELFEGRVPGTLFAEYYRAVKGKNQLVWSRGLRGLYALEETVPTDEEIASQTPEDCYLLGTLEYADWGLVRRYEARAQLLAVASSGDHDKITAFLEQLRYLHVQKTREGINHV